MMFVTFRLINKKNWYKNGADTVISLSFMYGRATWDKLPESIFENFQIARVKQGKFQNFQKSRWSFIPKITPTKQVIPG